MNIDTGVKLTAAQANEFAEIAADRQSTETTLRVAMSYHSNRQSEITKKERAAWDGILDANGLDFKAGQGYVLDSSGPFIKVMEVVPDQL